MQPLHEEIPEIKQLRKLYEDQENFWRQYEHGLKTPTAMMDTMIRRARVQVEGLKVIDTNIALLENAARILALLIEIREKLRRPVATKKAV